MSFSSLFADAATQAQLFEADYAPDKLKKAPRHWSPSQVKTHDRCRRLWWFEKICGLRSPGSVATQTGSRVHDCLERHLNGEIDLHNPEQVAGFKAPDKVARDLTEHVSDQQIAEIAAAGVHLLPNAKVDEDDDFFVEFSGYGLLDFDGFPLLGYIDVLDLRDPWHPLVLDHKTASSYRYTLGPEQLAVDTQILTYAGAVLSVYDRLKVPRPQTVTASHVVYLTKGPREARRTDVELTTSDVLDYIRDDLRPRVLSLRETAKARHPSEVPPTWSACGDYGGCPNQDRCRALRQFNNSNSETPMSKPTMSPLQRLRARRDGAAKPKTAAATPKTTTTAKPKTTAARRPSGARGRMASRLKGAAPAPAAAPAAEPSKPVRAQGVKPPDAAQPLAEPAPEPVKQTSGKVRRPANWKVKLVALGWAEEQVKSWPAAKVRDYIARSVTPDIAEQENAHEQTATASASGVRRLDAFKTGAIVENENGALFKVGTPVDDKGRIRITPPNGMAIVAKPDALFELAENGVARFRAQQPDAAGVGIGDDALPEQPAEPAEQPAPEQPAPEQPAPDEPAADKGEQARSAELPLDYAEPKGSSEPHAPSVILVDALVVQPPPGVSVVTIDELVAPFARLTEKHFEDDNGRPAPLPVGGYALALYNRGVRMVASLMLRQLSGEVAVISALDDLGSPTHFETPGAWWLLVNSAHPCAAQVLDVLTPRADFVVRGVK